MDLAAREFFLIPEDPGHGHSPWTIFAAASLSPGKQISKQTHLNTATQWRRYLFLQPGLKKCRGNSPLLHIPWTSFNNYFLSLHCQDTDSALLPLLYFWQLKRVFFFNQYFSIVPDSYTWGSFPKLLRMGEINTWLGDNTLSRILRTRWLPKVSSSLIFQLFKRSTSTYLWKRGQGCRSQYIE